jgi:hypothetical protein
MLTPMRGMKKNEVGGGGKVATNSKPKITSPYSNVEVDRVPLLGGPLIMNNVPFFCNA